MLCGLNGNPVEHDGLCRLVAFTCETIQTGQQGRWTDLFQREMLAVADRGSLREKTSSLREPDTPKNKKDAAAAVECSPQGLGLPCRGGWPVETLEGVRFQQTAHNRTEPWMQWSRPGAQKHPHRGIRHHLVAVGVGKHFRIGPLIQFHQLRKIMRTLFKMHVIPNMIPEQK